MSEKTKKKSARASDVPGVLRALAKASDCVSKAILNEAQLNGETGELKTTEKLVDLIAKHRKTVCDIYNIVPGEGPAEGVTVEFADPGDSAMAG